MDSELADGGRGRVSLSESFKNIGRDGGSNNAARPLSYTALFESVCPEYMAMGMSYDEFWNGDNLAPKMYRAAYKRKRELANEDAWMHGLYVQQAISACFSSRKNPFKYPDKPLGLEVEPEAGKDKPSVEEQHEKSDNKARQLLEIWAIGFNQRFEEKQREKQNESDGKEVVENG